MGTYQWLNSSSNLGNGTNWFDLINNTTGVEPTSNDVAIVTEGHGLTGKLDVSQLILASGSSAASISVVGFHTSLLADTMVLGGAVTIDRASVVAPGVEIAGGSTQILLADRGFLASNSLVVGSSSGNASLQVRTNSSIGGDSNGSDTGTLDLQIGGASGSVATLTLSAGGYINQTSTDIMIGAMVGATGIVNVVGSSSSMDLGTSGNSEIGDAGLLNGSAQGTLSVSDGASASLGGQDLEIGSTSGTALLSVSGANSTVLVGGIARIAATTANGEISVSSGGTFIAQGDVGEGYYVGSGTLAVTGAGSIFSAASFYAFGSTRVSGGGVIQAESVTQYGAMLLTQGDVTASGSFANDRGQSEVAGAGTVRGAGTVQAATINNTGVFDARGGTLHLIGAVSSNVQGFRGALHIEAGATLQLDSAVAASQSITFEKGAETLALADAHDMAAQFLDFASGDAIDLLAQAATGLSYAGGVLSVTDGTTKIAALHLKGSYSGVNFKLASDGHGGSQITYAATNAAGEFHGTGGSMPMFAHLVM